jgi:hypothetical protein
MELLTTKSPPFYCHFFFSDRSIVLSALFSSIINLCSSRYRRLVAQSYRVSQREDRFVLLHGCKCTKTCKLVN